MGIRIALGIAGWFMGFIAVQFGIIILKYTGDPVWPVGIWTVAWTVFYIFASKPKEPESKGQ